MELAAVERKLSAGKRLIFNGIARFDYNHAPSYSITTIVDEMAFENVKSLRPVW